MSSFECTYICVRVCVFFCVECRPCCPYDDDNDGGKAPAAQRVRRHDIAFHLFISTLFKFTFTPCRFWLPVQKLGVVGIVGGRRCCWQPRIVFVFSPATNVLQNSECVPLFFRPIVVPPPPGHHVSVSVSPHSRVQKCKIVNALAGKYTI